MSRRAPTLPPPPPPVHIRTWPDDQALLADRAGILGWLVGRSMGFARLAQFLLLVAGVQFGWLMAGQALRALAEEVVDPLGMIMGGLLAAFGLGVMTAAGIVLGLLLRRDGAMRSLTRQWAALASDPVRDARLRLPGVSLCWLLISFLVGAFGLWLSLDTPATARQGQDTYAEVVYLMGAGTLFWIAGLIGVTKAVGHYRWAVRLVTAKISPGDPAGVAPAG
ncbi:MULTISPECIES: hypothetical protein [unclassified Streptomyces]|uniref:hypothetical protein n=1 Tax=unclassified Streptomyces TaxID=2593676 RepID=UPI0036622F88